MSLLSLEHLVCGPLARTRPTGLWRNVVRNTTAPTSPLGGPVLLSFLTSKMQTCCLVPLLMVLVAATGQLAPNRYENFNAESIIQNERILLAYYKCVMDKGPCTKDGKNFKRVLPETLSSACSRCSPKQKLVVRKLLLGIRAKSEPRFLELLDKYDPERLNREALYSFLVTGN